MREHSILKGSNALLNFPQRWVDCHGDIEAQHKLVKLILERVYVNDNEVVALTLKSDFHIVLGHNGNEPTYMEVDPMVHTWARRGSNPRPYGCEPYALTG